MASKKSRSGGGTQKAPGVAAEKHFLLRLSECCLDHGASHNSTKQLPALIAITERDEMPEKCRKDMTALCKILPKVEDAYGIEKNPHPSYLPHLCDFYQSVIEGRFCPHAPLLFDWGKGGTAVMRRICSLYQHLASKAILNNTISVSKTDGSVPVADALCTTIAHMMSFIPSQRLQEALVRDLVTLAFDLAVACQLVQNENGIQVSLFEETIQQCKMTDGCVLKFNNVDSLVVTWSGTLSILAMLMKLEKEKRINSSYVETAESFEIKNFPTAHADSTWSFVLENGDLMSTTLASIRQVLLSTSDARASLVTRNKLAAAKIVNELLNDLTFLSNPPSPTIVQLALLVSRTLRAHLQSIQGPRQQEGRLPTSDDLQLSSVCGTLLCNAILFPPTKTAAALSSIRATVLFDLLDCIPHLHVVAKETPFVRNDVALAHLVLRGIHAALYTRADNDDEAFPLVDVAANHCIFGGIFPALFHLSSSVHLGDMATRILSALFSTGTTRPVDVTSTCRLTQTLYENEIAITEDLNTANAPSAEDTSASKRKRRSSHLSPYRPQLRIDRSPKRPRIGSTASVQPTPSPPSLQHASDLSNGRFASSSNANGSCNEALGSSLLRALMNARYIATMVDPCHSLFPTGNASQTITLESKEETTKSVVLVASALRLLLSLISKERSAVDKEKAKEMFQVASLLAMSLKAVALSISSHCRNSNARIPDEAHRCINCVLRVGLETQFAVGHVVADFPKLFADTITDFLDAAALCARDVWACHSRGRTQDSTAEEAAEVKADEVETSEDGTGSCGGNCSMLRRRLTGSDKGTGDWLPCLCRLLRLPDTTDARSPVSSSSEETFQSDCAMLLFERLSIHGICALLLCIRPMTKEEELDRLSANHPMASLFSVNSSHVQSITPAMVSLSPLFMLSAVSQTLWNKKSSDGSDEAMVVEFPDAPAHTDRDVLLQLSSFLGQVQYGRYLDCISDVSSGRQGSHALSEAAYSAIDQIHELCDMTLSVASGSPESPPDCYSTVIRESMSRPLAVLAFILGRRFSQESSPLNDDTQRRRKSQLCDAVEETYRSRRIALLSSCASTVDEGLSSVALVAKWKCLAKTCSRSTVSEMSQVRSRSSQKSKENESLGFEGDDSVDEGLSTKNPLIWILRSVLSNECSSFRFACGPEVGRVLTANNSSLLYALFSTASNWRRQDVDQKSASCEHSRCAALEFVVLPLFREIDRLLCRYCQVPQSQLSFTIGPSIFSGKASAAGTHKDASRTLNFQLSAVMALSSICHYTDVESSCGLLLFEHSIARLIRLWAASDEENHAFPCGLDTVSIPAVCFGQMVSLNEIRSFREVLLKKSDNRFMPRLFSDLLLPITGMVSSSGVSDTPSILERENRERQFRLLLTFIGSFLLPPPEKKTCVMKSATLSGSYCMHCVLEFVDEILPSVISAFIMAKDHDTLLLVTAFKLFVMGEERKIERRARKAARSGNLRNGPPRDEFIGSSSRIVTAKSPGIDASAKELVEHTKLLCLAPDMIELILPRILMKNDSSQLLFFLEVVLQKKMSLQQMVSLRDKLILKALVWEFGRTGDIAGANHALRTAAKARCHVNTIGTSGDVHEQSNGGSSSDANDDEAAHLWVTSSFMYLLVNVVQFHWQSRTPLERTQAIRCLSWIIEYLSPAEAPQYLPQIMATVNMVMIGEASGTWLLRLLSVQALSKFIRTAIQCQFEIIGNNLPTIVVSLFPVLSVDMSAMSFDHELDDCREAAKVAVDLLEWLTKGSNGQNLAMYFRDVPFLPPTKTLDNVRDALKAHGVSFDDLIVSSSTQNTPRTLTVARDSLTSDGDASHSDDQKNAHVVYSSSAQGALSRRINVVRRMFSHENTSVRRVVLQHLIDLLRANRGLFNRLVRSEEGTSLNRFVTVRSGSDAINGSVTSMVDSLLQRCYTEVDSEARLLLATCLGEVGAISVHRLGEMKMGSSQAQSTDDDNRTWRLKQAPWQSRPARYELRVVTNHLVVALKAAPTSADQHKIAFAIQQILVLLDESAKVSTRSKSSYANVGQASSSIEIPTRAPMSEWLKDKLSEAGIVETIEPYWFSNFRETEPFVVAKEPPFFREASSYFGWLSYWCRFMLKRSNDDGQNQWCSFFYACRTAVRSKAGMPLSEFILPLLVLDRICNGNTNDERIVINEFLCVFDFDKGSETSRMSSSERQKAVSCAFVVFDTLQHWADNETEDRYNSSRSSSSTARSSRRREDEKSSDCWLWEESISAIDSLMKAVPLSLQASAAAAVGMHARALRLLEMAARSKTVQAVYDNQVGNSPAESESKLRDRSPGGQKLIGAHVIDGIDTNLLKKILGQLNDCETMEAVAYTSDVAASALDDILVKESKGDWSGALYDYERALELNPSSNDRPELERGSLHCLLELGQLENVLHQVNGIVHSQLVNGCPARTGLARIASLGESHATPYAVEAAWRLGRWSTLTRILDDVEHDGLNRRFMDSDGLFRISLGNAVRGLYEKSEADVIASIRKARHALMSDLSNVARDSYSRSYSYLVRLHCLREVENASEIICNQTSMEDQSLLGEYASSCSNEGWNWDGRLAVASGAGSSDITDVRLALARLAGDAQLEGSLYLTVGTKARKNGLVNIAANFLSQAEACCTRKKFGLDESSTSALLVDDLLSSIRLQSAKLKHQNGESTAALRILGLGNVAGMLENDDKALRLEALSHERTAFGIASVHNRDESADINRFSRRLLQSTRWMVEGGIKGGSEVIKRFRIVQRLSPTWEKGYFQFARYIDSVLESRISALANRIGKSRQLSADDDAIRMRVVLNDESCIRYLKLSMEQYINALRFNSKHVYQALPRLLSLWFDFTSYRTSDENTTHANRSQRDGDGFVRHQTEANDLVARSLRMIPAHCFYTALPQLISHIGHRNQETSQIVKAILTRVLTKHPAQAMWSLAWLVHSADKDRACTGQDIFKGACSALSKRKEEKSLRLLQSARSLFQYLIEVAKYKPREGNPRSFNVKSWRGDADLADFIPPVQEALSVVPCSDDSGDASDAFPMIVPRMRTICSKVEIMHSKAKPKKIKAFVVPAEQTRSRRFPPLNGRDNKTTLPGDIGEMHFLVKQEAKGDLRKDARVQNLNNVINRLFAASSSSGSGAKQQRRLHLRTFAVTCLSEDCGILEWVPNTVSMRNLVIKSYNPQASPFSARRRGRRLGNYGENGSLKAAFEKCQSLYFKNGNLQQAASTFEELCLKPYPPLLYWYFVQHFMDPHSWYEARTRFTLSCAAWSAVGHVIGLGDRHSENILVDTTSGQCVHVDFDCIFDKGLLLPKPEIVPFRLSPNMLDAFGPIGADGMYTGSLKAAMTTLRDNRDTLLSVLEPFIKDPVIDWKRLKTSQSQHSRSTKLSDQRLLQAKLSITTIDERLQGIYNLRNPNHKKIKRTDAWSQDTDDDMMHMLPLSVEGQVHKMITEATSHENLVQLYVGWMPWV